MSCGSVRTAGRCPRRTGRPRTNRCCGCASAATPLIHPRCRLGIRRARRTVEHTERGRCVEVLIECRIERLSGGRAVPRIRTGAAEVRFVELPVLPVMAPKQEVAKTHGRVAR